MQFVPLTLRHSPQHRPGVGGTGRHPLFWAALGLAVWCCAPVRAADSPASQLAHWTTQARTAEAGFTPSAARGQALFVQSFATTPGLASCSACHTNDPTAEGRHAVTGKRIAPLSPRANAERFADAAKSEKWFRRNCKEVMGSECSPAQKADVLSYLMKGSNP